MIHEPTNELERYIMEHPCIGPFKSVPHYSKIGDFVNLYFEDVFCYTEHYDNNDVDVHRNLQGKIVGIKFYGVKYFLRQLTKKARKQAWQIIRNYIQQTQDSSNSG